MKQEPRQLLDDTFLATAYEKYGNSVIDWPDPFKDSAVKLAMRTGTRDQLNDIMFDFWANHSLVPLYDFRVTEVKNNVWAYFEPYLQIDLEDWIQANITPRLRSVK